MRVQILDEDYRSPDQAKLSSPFRRDWELFWIKKGRVKGVGTLGSSLSGKINVYNLVNLQNRRKKSDGKVHYNKKAPQQELSMILVYIMDMIYPPEGVHHMRKKMSQC